MENVAEKKDDTNIFKSPSSLKRWALDLSDSCGSVIANKPYDMEQVQKLIDKFVNAYNVNLKPTTKITKT